MKVFEFRNSFQVLLMNFYLRIYVAVENFLFNTQYALPSLIEKCKKTLDNEGCTGAVLIDFSKAFDTINHEL